MMRLDDFDDLPPDPEEMTVENPGWEYVLEPDHSTRPARQGDHPWAATVEDRRVAEDTVGVIGVSTVFLIMDHGHGRQPQLFETMIFGHPDGGTYMWRYATWDDAKAGHDLVVKALREGGQLP